MRYQKNTMDEELGIIFYEEKGGFLLCLDSGCEVGLVPIYKQVYFLNGILIKMQKGEIEKDTGLPGDYSYDELVYEGKKKYGVYGYEYLYDNYSKQYMFKKNKKCKNKQQFNFI